MFKNIFKPVSNFTMLKVPEFKSEKKVREKSENEIKKKKVFYKKNSNINLLSMTLIIMQSFSPR